MFYKRLLGGITLLALVALGGCATNPVTGRSQLSLVSPEQEVAMGEANYLPSQQSQGGQYNVDPDLQTYVAEVGYKLAEVSDRKGLPYEFVVLNNSVPNAWALPGGKIAVNRGLLLELEDEAELAAVLGHEIVHAAARHSASQISRGTLINMTTQIASIASAQAGYGELGSMAAQAGGAAFMAKYGRDDELEADKYGMKYMSLAGYDTQAAVSLQEKFVKLNEGRRSDFISGLFASHPPSQDRVDANRKHASTLPEAGVRNRERYQVAIARIRRDQPAYEFQGKAVAALKNKDPQGALALLDKSVEIQPGEAQFWELRGHAWQMLEDPDKAEKAYSTAIRKNPDLFSPQLYRGLLRYERGNYEGAQEDLYLSYRLLPTPVATYYLGELALRRGENEQALGYFSTAARSGNKQLAQQAQKRMIPLDLSKNPNRYIASKAYVAKDGYLHIAVKNNSGLPVDGIRMQLIEKQNPFDPGTASTLKASYQLAVGQQIDINTRLGPFTNPEVAQYYTSRVSAARVAN